MSILDEAVSGAADGELEPQMTTTAQPILATPPSCTPATSIPSGPKFTATIRFGDNKAGGHWEYMLNTSLGHCGWGGITGVPFNSGQLSLDMTVELDGPQALATLSVLPAPPLPAGLPLSFPTTPAATVTRVAVRAEATRQFNNQTLHLRSEWSSLDIGFFDQFGNNYPYPGLANPSQVCPMPFYAETPAAPGFGTAHQTRIILPGSVQNALYPVRMTLNGTLQFSSNNGGPEQISANQLVAKVLVWAT